MDAFVELFSFQGRANRAWYFWHVLLDDVVILTAIVLLVLGGAALDTGLLVLPALAVMFTGVWAAVAITVKRLHDLGRPGWHVLLFMVPLYNLWLGLVLVFKPGTPGPNRFGRDPLHVSAGFAMEGAVQ